MVLQSLKSAGIRFLTTMASASKPTGPIQQAASQSLIRKIPVKVGPAHHQLQTRLKSQSVEGKAIDNPISPPREEDALTFRDVLLACCAPLVLSVGCYIMLQGRIAVPLDAIRRVAAMHDGEDLNAFVAYVEANHPEDSEICLSFLKKRFLLNPNLQVAAGTQKYPTDEGRNSEVPTVEYPLQMVLEELC